MKLRRAIAAGLALLFLGTLGLAYPSEAEDHPIVLTVETAPDTELAEGGTVSYLTFTLENRSENAYTMYEAVLSGGFDGAERPLNDAIEIEAHGKKEFTLQNVPVRDEQLDTDVIYTLTWQEYVYSEEDIPDPTEEEVRHALSGNLCRCGTYPAVLRAVLRAARLMKEEGGAVQ